jgi:3-carboxy-cis,cis-muconate cycloisomerase
MLDFERALAGAEAEAGLVPPEAAQVIARACADLSLSPDALAADSKRSGSLAVPLVKALTEHVTRVDPRAAAFVHFGSTSQDVLDTALVLCLKPCLADADGVLAGSVSRLAAHARRHAGAVMLSRTLMQPATPITAGVKIARWAAALHRCRLRLAETRERALCIQLGGAVGTLDAIGGKRAMVRNGLAMRLRLHEARAWHDQRDELVRLMAELAIVTTTVGKIARDVSLLSQAEVGEMLEAAPVKGVGGSSAMPHKRNPVACLQALTAAVRVPGLMATVLSSSVGEHERALGGWQAELVTIPELLDATGSALDALERIAGGLVVNPERMKANLEALQGLVFSERLARVIARETDRASALALVDDWSAVTVKEGRHLKDVAVAARPSLAGRIDGVFSFEAVVAELVPVLDETLAGLPADA